MTPLAGTVSQPSSLGVKRSPARGRGAPAVGTRGIVFGRPWLPLLLAGRHPRVGGVVAAAAGRPRCFVNGSVWRRAPPSLPSRTGARLADDATASIKPPPPPPRCWHPQAGAATATGENVVNKHRRAAPAPLLLSSTCGEPAS